MRSDVEKKRRLGNLRAAQSGLPPSDCMINEQSIEPVEQSQSTRPHKIYSSRAADWQNQMRGPNFLCKAVCQFKFCVALHTPPTVAPTHTLRLNLNTITAGAVKIYFIDKVKQGALGVCVCNCCLQAQHVEQEFVF
jgi:hypothetical protein